MTTCSDDVIQAGILGQQEQIADLRAAVDPNLRERCACCRRCGPVPCMEVVRGEACEGLCACGLDDSSSKAGG